tara:strand:+ start:167 stop:631 length:465 start_codon:yes stop_codon:yes gene_type:complete
MPQNKNPYSSAAGAYDNHARAHTTDQRELEARILLKANRMFQAIIDKWDTNLDLNELEEALKYNRQIWVLFYDTAIENKDGDRPNDLRSNIVNLANFIFKREMDILAAPEKRKLDVLININREISAGLMTNQAKDQGQQKSETQSTHQQTDISG